MTSDMHILAVAMAMVGKESGIKWSSLSEYRKNFWLGIARAGVEESYAWLKAQGVDIPPLPATKLELEAYYRDKAMSIAEELLDEALEKRGVSLGQKSTEGVDR